MSYGITLYQDTKLNDNVKQRNGILENAIVSSFAVNIGNFSHLNIFVDNGVELALGDITTPISTYDRAIQATHIKIVYDGQDQVYTIIGAITSFNYINDGNVFISYKVDALTSAIQSNFIDDISGLCERTHLDYTDSPSMVNLQGEPFSVSDTVRPMARISQMMNEFVYQFEGIPPTNNGLIHGQTDYILTVSPAVMEYLDLSAFNTPPTTFAKELKNVDDLKFKSMDMTIHSGGIYRGTPLKFESHTELATFITNITSGCGFRTIMPSDGYDGDGTYRKNYTTPETTGAGMVQVQEKTSESYEFESIRFIQMEDIYNLYLIPSNFAVYGTAVFTQNMNVVNNLPTLSDFHGLKAENNQMSKFLMYPYLYYKIKTANNDSVNVYPQIYNNRADVFTNLNELRFDLKYIGGDNPRLMARLIPYFTDESPLSQNTVAEWFTVRNYPCIPLSLDGTNNSQVQKDISNIRQLSATQINATANNKLSNPIKQGYIDSVAGNDVVESDNGSYYNRFLYRAGSNFTENFGQNLFKDDVAQTVDNAVTEMNAGGYITPTSSTTMGNDFLSQFAIPPFYCYAGGGANAEMFGICRYVDNFGVACNCIINPLTNTGDIFGGRGFITTNPNGYTFYKFAYINIVGRVPNPWKQKIQQLFESGVYIYG